MGVYYRTSTGLGETETPLLEGGGRTHTNSGLHQDPGRRAVTPQETGSDLPASVGGSPVEVWVGMAHHRESNTGWSTSGRCPLEKFLLEVTINPTIGPIDVRAGSPQMKQQTGRKHNPSHQEITGLKFY